MDLDASYAYLSERSHRAVGHSLAVLANRAPTEELFEMYDLKSATPQPVSFTYVWVN